MQGSFEGGFMGRTNKLVDGCYSFWQVSTSSEHCKARPCPQASGIPGLAGLTHSLQSSSTAQLRQAQSLQSSSAVSGLPAPCPHKCCFARAFALGEIMLFVPIRVHLYG